MLTVQGAPSFQNLLAATSARVNFGDTAVFVSFRFCKTSPILHYAAQIKFFGSPSWTLVVAVLWSAMNFLSEVTRHVYCISQQKVL